MMAVESLLKNHRLDEINVADIAKAARVGKGTIYLHFSSKADLILQTITAGIDDLCKVLPEIASSASQFEQRLSWACSRIGSFFEQKQHLLRILISERSTQRPSVSHMGAVGQQWQKRLCVSFADVLRKEASEGRIRADIELEVLADMLLSMLWARARSVERHPCPPQHYELVADLFCRGAVVKTGGKPGPGGATQGSPKSKGICHDK